MQSSGDFEDCARIVAVILPTNETLFLTAIREKTQKATPTMGRLSDGVWQYKKNAPHKWLARGGQEIDGWMGCDRSHLPSTSIKRSCRNPHDIGKPLLLLDDTKIQRLSRNAKSFFIFFYFFLFS